MKKFLTATAIILVVLLGILAYAGSFMCNFALKPSKEGHDLEYYKSRGDTLAPGVIAWFDSLGQTGAFRDTSLTGEGGFRLHGMYALSNNPHNSQGTALIIHGYTDDCHRFLGLARMYRDSLNYNVFLPDLHYHGQSEGKAAQMGWLDRLDAEKFAAMAHDIFNDDFMVVHGVSMGAATTMMMSGDETPSYVKAFVEDCGYSSVWNQFAYNLKDSFGLPTFPVLDAASIVCKLRYGWSFKEASSLEQLAKCEKPMLFIHGGDDDFVPTPEVYLNYDAKVKGYKDMWIAEGSAHAKSFTDYPAEYTAKVRDFLSKAREQ